METISDFSKELKERLSNPLFYSFLLSWAAFNWKILLGLFFYNNQELRIDGYTSYLDLVSKNLSASNTLWKPLLVASLYTFIFPFIRNLILAFNSWIKTWGNTWRLKISKASKISISKYVQLREIYDERTALLQEVLEKEGKILNDYELEKNKVLSITNAKNEISRELEKWKSINDVSLIAGDWEVHYQNHKERSVYRIKISNSIIEFLDTPPSGIDSRLTIRSFFRRPDATFLTMTTLSEDASRNRTFHFFQMDILDDFKILRGTEDDLLNIEFRKY